MYCVTHKLVILLLAASLALTNAQWSASSPPSNPCTASVVITQRPGSSWSVNTITYNIYDVVVENTGSCQIGVLQLTFPDMDKVAQTWNWQPSGMYGFAGVISIPADFNAGASYDGSGFVLPSPYTPSGLTVTTTCADSCTPQDPTQSPTEVPVPTQLPSSAPSSAPTQIPSSAPSSAPTQLPSSAPSSAPTQSPSPAPSQGGKVCTTLGNVIDNRNWMLSGIGQLIATSLITEFAYSIDLCGDSETGAYSFTLGSMASVSLTRVTASEINITAFEEDPTSILCSGHKRNFAATLTCLPGITSPVITEVLDEGLGECNFFFGISVPVGVCACVDGYDGFPECLLDTSLPSAPATQAPSSAPSPAPSSAPSAPSTECGSGVTVTAVIDSTWEQDGEQYQIINLNVFNGGQSAISAITLTLTTDGTITSDIWNLQPTSGNNYLLATYGSTIQPGASHYSAGFELLGASSITASVADVSC